MSKTPPNDPFQSVASSEGGERIAEAINILYQELEEATRCLCDPASEHGGREGAIKALAAVLGFLGGFPKISQVSMPLTRLLLDMLSLDSGTVTALLKPKHTDVRPPAGLAHHLVKGIALYTVRRLRATGMKRDAAHIAVATELSEAGIRPARKGSATGEGLITKRTVRGWDENSDLASGEWAAVVLYHMENFLIQKVIAAFGLVQ
jgi:hypothetical protein